MTRLQIKFDKQYLNTLTQDSDSGVRKQTCKYHIALHPAQFTDFGQAVRDELGRKIARYDDIFGGIMLGFENVKLVSSLGDIGLDNCFIHIDVQADFFIFKPEIGMELKGVVTRTTKDHVGCLVYSTFNISLPKPKDQEEWLGNKVGIQSEVQFRIIYADLNARLPYIRGQLLSILKNAEINLPLTPQKGKSVNKKINFDSLDEVVKPQGPKKTKGTKNIVAGSLSTSQIKHNDSLDNSVTREHKKKTKKNNKLQDTLDTVPVNNNNGEDFPQEVKRRKIENNSASEDTLEMLQIKQNDSETEEPKKDKKRNKWHDDSSEDLLQEPKRRKIENNLEDSFSILQNIKQEDVDVKVEINGVPKPIKEENGKKSKKNLVQNEEDITFTKDKHKEMKLKQENNMDDSLESLDLKTLFEDVSVNMDSSQSQIQMANSDDRKRRKSISQELYLENIKLEVDSEIENIRGKKRKRSKSMSTEVN